jgi:uncharacterized protein YkwD
MPAPLALGLTVAGLLGALGLGAALLPDSVTGKGVAADARPAAVEQPAGEAGGGPVTAPPDASPTSDGQTSAGQTSAGQTSDGQTSDGQTSDGPAPAESTSAQPAPAPAKPKPAGTTTKPKVTPPKVGADQESQENEVIRLVNVERGKAGCGAVRMDERLRTAIRLHVQELGTHGNLYISHVSDDGRTFVDRAKAQGYTAPGGENVARGQRDAVDVMKSWMNSQGHRDNILNCSFKAIGVGVVKGVDNTLVWGQIFGRS